MSNHHPADLNLLPASISAPRSQRMCPRLQHLSLLLKLHFGGSGCRGISRPCGRCSNMLFTILPILSCTSFKINTQYWAFKMTDYTQQAKAWLDQDPDPKTRATLQSYLDNNDTKALSQAFGDRLAFGTAGLRGVLGVGPNNMNVRFTTRGKFQ